MAEKVNDSVKDDTSYMDLNTPNRYDPMIEKLLVKRSISSIAKSNPNFSLEHEDFKNGNSLFWQQVNREVRRLILEIQDSKDPKIQEAIKDSKVLIEDWKPIGQSWYRNAMELTITLNRLEWDIKLWRMLKNTKKITLNNNNSDDPSKVLDQLI